MPAVSADDKAAVEEMVKRNLDTQIFAFCRAMPGDIELAADCGVDGVVIESPVNQSFIKHGCRQHLLFERSSQSCRHGHHIRWWNRRVRNGVF